MVSVNRITGIIQRPITTRGKNHNFLAKLARRVVEAHKWLARLLAYARRDVKRKKDRRNIVDNFTPFKELN